MSTSLASPALSRRAFLASTATLTGALCAAGPWRGALASTPLLKVETRTIEVNRKAAKAYAIIGPGGRHGIFAREGDRFSGTLLNASDQPLQMHWHGQTKAPADQDRARPGGGALELGQSDHHDFELNPGTHWMHSHTLTEQQLLAAPMIAREGNVGDVQDVVVMLHDFAFRTPQEILSELGGSDAHAAPGHSASPRPGVQDAPGHGGGAVGHSLRLPHANDVRYDAFLANERTLDDPERVSVEKGGRVRLRIINGATATAFFLSTPGIASRCVAVDGTPCRPVGADRYPLAQGQRIDLMIEIPSSGGAFPLLAQVEAAQFVTGIILATPGAEVKKLPATVARPESMIDLELESRLVAEQPLSSRKADKTLRVVLGEEAGYRWTINGRIHGEHTALDVRQGDRVEMIFMNPTSMMHPMHLHGHHFQVVAVAGRRVAGAVRDTMIVPPHAGVMIAFDAKLKGSWFLHCHHLYHMATGMMTEVRIT